MNNQTIDALDRLKQAAWQYRLAVLNPAESNEAAAIELNAAAIVWGRFTGENLPEAPKAPEAPTKKKKVKKDPNAPKKPTSSYMCFSKAKRAEIKASHPNMSLPEIGRKTGELWRGLDDDEKAIYTAKAVVDRARYVSEMEKYAPNIKPAQPAAPSATSSQLMNWTGLVPLD
jgi:hypothetical protein